MRGSLVTLMKTKDTDYRCEMKVDMVGYEKYKVKKSEERMADERKKHFGGICVHILSTDTTIFYTGEFIDYTSCNSYVAVYNVPNCILKVKISIFTDS